MQNVIGHLGRTYNFPKINRDEFSTTFGTSWVSVAESEQIYRPPSRCFGHLFDWWCLSEKMPELGVLELINPCVGPNGLVQIESGEWLPDCTFFAEGGTHSVPSVTPNALKVHGRVLILTSYFTDCYYHFVCDCLGRLALVTLAGLAIKDFDFVYISSPKFPVAKELLRSLGIMENNILYADRIGWIQPDKALVTTFPGLARNIAPIVSRYLQENCAHPSRKQVDQKLYISREGYVRTIVNESQIISLLQQHGFKICDPARLPSQIEDFSTSNIVIGSHGAGLTNLTFPP